MPPRSARLRTGQCPPHQDAAQPVQREAPRAASSLADRLVLETVAVDHGAALDLAEAKRFASCDASYLWLARALGGELVTLDRKLAAAKGR